MQFLIAGPLVEVGVHKTTYLRGVYNPLVSGQLAWDLGNNWGFSYLLGAYLDVNSEVAWSSTSLNQRFALSYTGNQLNLTANVIWGTQLNHVTGNTQLSPCPAPLALNGCNPDFLNVDLTATRKFGDWEFGVVAFGSTDLTSPIEAYAKQSQIAVGGLIGKSFGGTHPADLSHHGRVREELWRPRHPFVGTRDHPTLGSPCCTSSNTNDVQEGVRSSFNRGVSPTASHVVGRRSASPVGVIWAESHTCAFMGTQGRCPNQRPLFYLSPWFCAPS